ncbi:MAG: hypothetical protein K0S45_2946 [Nitrospira sp.]|jgi:threonine dehydratase|nr:hypothetical protein [Nitrospira sp.]
MTRLGRRNVCGSDTGVHEDVSGQFICASSANHHPPISFTAEHKKIYCLACLDKLFHLPTVKVRKVTNVGARACPRCEGPGPLVWIQ